jgi:hypothetical protein
MYVKTAKRKERKIQNYMSQQYRPINWLSKLMKSKHAHVFGHVSRPVIASLQTA